MLNLKTLRNLATKLQTTQLNIVREYLQHLFLKHFYQQSNSHLFLFKGGTALRIVYDSPRFSEDLDFSVQGSLSGSAYEQVLEGVLLALNREGVELELLESKATSGGWLSLISLQVFDHKLQISNQISFRDEQPAAQNVLISSEFTPAYHLVALEAQTMVKEKVQALVTRGKARDFFDLYFILRDSRLRTAFQIRSDTRQKVISQLNQQSAGFFQSQLKPLLPLSYQALLKNFAQRLESELR